MESVGLGLRHRLKSSTNIHKNKDVYLFPLASNVPLNPPGVLLTYDRLESTEGKLHNILLCSNYTSIAIAGEQGVGKTCAIRGLATDSQIRRRFSSGCFYIPSGLDGADSSVQLITQTLFQIAKCTGGSNAVERMRRADSFEQVCRYASYWFGRGRCLFLVDDIMWWDGIGTKVIEALAKIPNKYSRIVYTTKDNRLTASANYVIRFRFWDPKGEPSRRLLTSYIGSEMLEDQNSENNEAIEDVLEVCGGLPLAIAISGRSVHKRSFVVWPNDVWKDYYQTLKRSLEGYGELDRISKSYFVLESVLDSSISSLVASTNDSSYEFSYEEMFRALCVLEKQQQVPLSMLQRLWCLPDLSQVRAVVEHFTDVGILEMQQSKSASLVGVHDLILDIAKRKACEFFEVRDWFQTLVESYRSRGSLNPPTINSFDNWWDVPNDEYIHENLCRLLKRSGYFDELLALLTNPNWIVTRLQRSGENSVRCDLTLGREALKELPSLATMQEGLNVLEEAVLSSSAHVHSRPAEAWYQLHGRLLRYAKECPEVQQFVSQIEKCAPRPWVKASMGFLEQAGETGWDEQVFYMDAEVYCVQRNEEGFIILSVRENDIHVAKRNWKLNGSQTWIFDGEANRIQSLTCVAMSSNTKTVVTGHEDGSMLVWDVQRGKVLHELHGHEGAIQCVAISDNGTRVASGAWDGILRLWDFQEGKVSTLELVGHKALVSCIAFSRDQSVVVSGSWDRTVRAWDASVGEPLGEPLKGHRDYISCVSIGARKGTVLSGSVSGTIRLWDLTHWETRGLTHEQIDSSRQGRTTAEIMKTGIRNLQLHRTETDFTAIGGEYRMKPLSCSMNAHKAEVLQVLLNKDETIIMSGSLDKTLRVFKYDDREVQLREDSVLFGHTGAVSCIAMNNAGSGIISGSFDKSVRLWDFRRIDGEEQLSSGHKGLVTCVALSSDGTQIVSGSRDRTIRVFDASSGDALGKPLIGHNDFVTCVVTNADGSLIVSGSEDSTVRVWEACKGGAIGSPLFGHGKSVECVALSFDGTRIVSGSRDCTVRLWDAKSQAAIGNPLVGHSDTVNCVAMNADGTRIVSGSYDNTIRVWDFRGEKLEKELFLDNKRGFMRCLVMSADGSRIVSVSQDFSVQVWDSCTGQAVIKRLPGGLVARVGVDEHCSKIVAYEKVKYRGKLWDISARELGMTSYDKRWNSVVNDCSFSWSSVLWEPEGGDIYDTSANLYSTILGTSDNRVQRIGDIYFDSYFRSCKVER